MNTVRFLQLSDLHLGSRVLPRCFSVTSTVRKEREQEIISGLEKLIDICKEDDIEVVLAAGDLFDRDTVDTDIVNVFFDILAEFPPVFILPGNHDYISGASPYSTLERAKRGLTEIPDNVQIFSGSEYSTLYLPQRADVSITGKPFRSNVIQSEHLLAEKIPRDPTPITILLHHGARTQFVFEEAVKITSPFTASELLAQGFSYTALGHYHSFSTIKNAEGMVKAAYSGRPFACEFSARNGSCLGGVISPEGVEELIHYDIDKRKIYDLTVYCDNVESNKQIQVLAQEELEKQEISTADLIRFIFRGTKINDFKPELLLPSDIFFALAADFTELAVGYDVQELLKESEGKAASAESLYARNIYDLLARSESEDEKRILFAALDYGMKALRGNKIIPNDVSDITEE